MNSTFTNVEFYVLVLEGMAQRQTLFTFQIYFIWQHSCARIMFPKIIFVLQQVEKKCLLSMYYRNIDNCSQNHIEREGQNELLVASQK